MSRGAYLTHDEKLTISAMAERGVAPKEIAAALGRHPNSMARWLKRWRDGTLLDPYVRRKDAPPPIEKHEPWKPGDPKPDWLKRGAR